MPKHLLLYLLSLSCLLLTALVEKFAFALYHSGLSDGLGLGGLLATFAWGLKFDLAVAALLALLAYLGAYLPHRLLRRSFARGMRLTTYLGVALLVGLHGADLLYYGEVGRHLGYELSEWYNSAGALTATAFGTYTLPTLLQLVLLVPLLWGSRLLLGLGAREEDAASGWRRLLPEVQLLAVVMLAAILVRGGLGSVPLEPLHAQEIGDSRQATLALNGAYNSLFSSFTRYSVQPILAEPPNAEQLALVRSMYRDRPAQPSPAAANAAQPNVVIVFLESWTAAYMRAYGFEQSTTPHFDKLRAAGLSSRQTLAGGHRTTEGMYATLCSAQNPLGQTVAQSQLQNYDYHCLPSLLEAQGYSSAFFQGTLKNTSGTGAFAQLLGFRKSYGKKDVPDARLPHNSWGLHDPDLYRFALDKMAGLPQPFLVGINTNSTHDHQLPDGAPRPFTEGGRLADYLNALHYADAALQQFVDELYRRPGMKNTVLVLLADHTGMSPGDNFHKYAIPFTIYQPGRVAARELDAVTSQRDVAPTLLQLLGLAPVPWFTGQSLLAESDYRFADYYQQGVLGWVEPDTLVEVPVRKLNAYTCLDPRAPETQVACTPRHAEAVARATAFTRLSQWLLFSGQTAQFNANGSVAREALRQAAR